MLHRIPGKLHQSLPAHNKHHHTGKLNCKLQRTPRSHNRSVVGPGHLDVCGMAASQDLHAAELEVYNCRAHRQLIETNLVKNG